MVFIVFTDSVTMRATRSRMHLGFSSRIADFMCSNEPVRFFRCVLMG